MRSYGSGTVFHDKNKNKFIARIIIGTTDNGTYRYKSKSGKNERELKQWLKLQQKAILLGKYDEPVTIDTIPSIATKINDDKHAMNVIKDSTYGRHKATIQIISDSNLADIPIKDVTQADLTQFYVSLTNYSQSTISKVCRIVRQAYRHAVLNDMVTKNIAEAITTPKSRKQNKKVLAFTLEQQRQFIDDIQQAQQPYRTMLLLSMFTGMRMGEISALNRRDVNLSSRTISVTKTVTRDEHGNVKIGDTAKTDAGTRTIDLNQSAFAIINSYISNTKNKKFLFTTNRGDGVINTCTVNAEFKKYAPPGFSQHCLRHTFATRCIESGMPVKVLSNILGHSSIKITLDTYCDVFEAYSREHISNADKYMSDNGLSVQI